jgi:hypothetical protein
VGVTRSWVTTKVSALGVKVHRVRGWIHRRLDPNFDGAVAAVQHAVTAARVDGRAVWSVTVSLPLPDESG